MRVVQPLLDLQEIDSRIREFEQELKDIPLRIAQEKKRLDGALNLLATAQADLKTAQMRVDDLAAEVQTRKDKVQKLKQEQSELKSNNDYKMFSLQINTLENEISKLEGQQLIAMDNTIPAKRRVADAEAKLSSEQAVIVHKMVYAAVKDEFAHRGCYFLKGGELEKVRKTIIINGALNAKIVGQSAFTIASLAGVKVPEGAKILIGEVESVELSEEFAHEKLSPVLAMYKAENLEDAFAKAVRHLLIEAGGPQGGWRLLEQGQAAAEAFADVSFQCSESNLNAFLMNAARLQSLYELGAVKTDDPVSLHRHAYVL